MTKPDTSVQQNGGPEGWQLPYPGERALSDRSNGVEKAVKRVQAGFAVGGSSKFLRTPYIPILE